MTLMPNLKAAAEAANVSWHELVTTLDSEIVLAILGDAQPLADGIAEQFPAVIPGSSIADDSSAIAASVSGGESYTTILARAPRIDISNTSNETNILQFSIPGGALGTNRQMRVHFGGLLTNSTGTSRTAQFSIYYSTTLLWRDNSVSMASNALGRGVWVTLLLSNEGATNVQDLSGHFVIGGTGGTTVGRGDLGSDEIASHAAIDGASAVNSLLPHDFRVAVDFSGPANPNLSLTRYRCIAEVL